MPSEPRSDGGAPAAERYAEAAAELERALESGDLARFHELDRTRTALLAEVRRETTGTGRGGEANDPRDRATEDAAHLRRALDIEGRIEARLATMRSAVLEELRALDGRRGRARAYLMAERDGAKAPESGGRRIDRRG